MERLNRDVAYRRLYLEDAIDVLQAQEKRVQKLQTAYFTSQLQLYQIRIQNFESKLASLKKQPDLYREFLEKKLPTVFLEERKVLSQIIESHGDQELKAQAVLDRILRIITHLSQDKKA